ncbi:MAG: hypothetical protein QF600_07935 [Verrucomicrobiota bacterium]|jgi:hypothetical protein|nr:hypothetical protein [Verrucomicrobiota bacterium]
MLPVDLLALHLLGMNIFDNCHFLEVGKNCNRHKVSTFLQAGNPLDAF